MIDWLHDALDGSRLAGLLGYDRTDVSDARTVTDGSAFLAAAGTVERTLSRAAGAAVVGRLTERAARVARESWLYRWLTTEPDPDVVVIDLRETVTVGPLIAGLDRFASWVGPRWRASGAYRVVDWLSTTLGPAGENASVAGVMRSALAPPERDPDVRTGPSTSDDD